MLLSESQVDSFVLRKILAPGYRSIRSVEEVDIRFINNSRDVVDLCWIDFQGNLVRYLKLNSRETVKLTTFIGHCWVARFIRNGAVAQFLPDRTEVFVTTRRFPYTTIVFIIQKVPTLFETAVEYIGELLHECQQALCRLPVPELVKGKLYNKEEICSILTSEKDGTFPQQLSRILANGQLNLCLQAVSDLSMECSDFKINELFLTCLKKEFVVMGFSTTCNYAKKWIDFLSRSSLGISNHCLLLKQLVCCTDLLQNKQLRLLLHENLPQIYRHLCCMKQYSAASVIAEVIFYTVAIPAAYSDDYNREASWNMWSEMLHSEECTKSAHFNLCTVLIMISLNFDCTNYIQCLGNAVSDLDESDDSLLNPRKQFLVLLEANLSSVLLRCQPNQSELLLNALIIFHLEKNDLFSLVQVIFRHSGLVGTHSFQMLQLFFRCLLLNLSAVIDEIFSGQKKSLILWIKKSVMETLSISSKDCDNELESWKVLMSAFVPVSSQISILDRRFYQIIQAVCGKGFSLGTLPVSLQVGLFCVLISLIPCLPSELFEIAIESTLSIMRSDTKLFYDLINSCKEKILRRYIRILLHCGYSINNSKSAQFLVKEFLVSSSDHDTLARKCNTVLQDSSQMILAEEQCYFLKPLCNAFGEIHSEISADESSTLGLCAKEVLQLIYRLISPFDYKSPTKLTIFELSLPVLSVFLQRNDSTAEKNENIIQHMKIADRLCKVVCKHPDRLTEFVVPEHLPQLLRSSIMWMVKRGKLENIISWKYVKNFKLYDRSTVNYIITVASVEMLRNLLHSTSFNLHVLEKFSLYSALAEHKSEDKKKLLSTVLKDILEVVAVMAETDHLIAIDFLRHIFPIAAGSPYERDFISFALTVLAVNCGSLVEDCVALRSALSLILDCLRFGPNSVINDQCSVYASLFICVGRAIEKHVNDVSPISPHLIRHLSYGCAKVANEMVKYERSFSRLAPFIISEYLEEAKCLSLALFRIFSMCDRHSIALLTTNLPPLRKTRFINLSLQFKKIKMVL